MGAINYEAGDNVMLVQIIKRQVDTPLPLGVAVLMMLFIGLGLWAALFAALGVL
jgi:hypothetical protein